jgi:glycosyltransferase involved in cell wall biosynthesis
LSDFPFRRVLVLTQYYPPESGAPAIRLRAMVRELGRLGCEVRVLTGMPNYPTGKIHPGYEGLLTRRDEIDGVPVRRVWLFPASGKSAARRLLNYLSFTATSALALILEGDADLVFVEAQPITLAVPAFINRVVRGRPYVYNTPDLQVEYADEDRWVGLRMLIRGARSLEGFLMKQAFAVTTVTHAFIDHFEAERGISRGKLTFLPNGADTDRLRPVPRDKELAARLGVGDRKVFTFAGTHAPYQGLEVILDAAKLLMHRRDIALLMVGDGPVRQQLIARAEAEGLDNVLFRSSPFDEMPRLMSLTYASLVVLRKLQIAHKMRLSKAIPPLACGVPLVYAGWGESAEIVEREGVGVRVEPENPKALAEAIKRLSDEPNLRDAMGKRGRALAEREFSWSFIVGDWVRQLARVAEGVDPEVPLPAGVSPASAVR